MIDFFKYGETIKNKRVPRKSFIEMYPVSVNSKEKCPLVLVIPGGGYNHLANHEGEGIAKWLNTQGIQAAVFYYQLQPVCLQLLLDQLNDCMDSLKDQFYLMGLEINQIGMIGFSAGGNLAALASTKNKRKPDFLILGYPVITLEKPFTHEGSRTKVLGESSREQDRLKYSPDQWVSLDTPPVFLWHTANDQSVSVENSLLFAQQLSKQNIPFEFHVFPEGRHGLGLAREVPIVAQWTILLKKWLEKIVGKEFEYE